MKMISKVAFAAALLSGASTLVVVTPAFAKDDKPAAAAPAFKFSSQEVVKALSAAKTAVEANDVAGAEPLVAQAEAIAKNDDDKYVAVALRLQLEDAKSKATGGTDRSRMIAPYQALIANPKTPPANAAAFAYDLGVIYYNSKQYPQSITYFEQAQRLGSTEPNLSANIVRAKMFGGDSTGGLTELGRMVDAQVQQKGRADDELYRFAISKSIQAKDAAGTLSWMRRYLTAYPTPKNWRDMIKIYGMQQGAFITPTRSQSLDLYRLMRATGALADQYDYETYARMASQAGLPWEAKTVITDGRAKGKLPATGESAQLLTVANKGIAAEGSLAPLEAKSKTAVDGKLAAQTGDAQLGSANYAKAVDLYRLALQKGGVDASAVNTKLGIALAMSGDKAGAKTAFAAVTGSPNADIAALWTTYADLPAAG